MSSGRGFPAALGAVLAAAISLSAVGVLFVHSTTSAGEPFPNEQARNQILKLLVAAVGFLTVARLDYRLFERYAYSIYIALSIVLVGMFLIKWTTRSTMNRFINFSVFQIQPSELMKIGLILVLARFLRFRDDQNRAFGLFGPFALTLVPLVLVLLQPDMGTGLMFPPVLLGMLLVAGARKRHLACVVLVGAALITTLYVFGDRLPLVRESSWERYQRERISAFLHRDEASRAVEGHQLRQSEIAIGSGGLTGRGFLRGTQNRGDRVPEKRTDFIFSIVAEEWGFIGAAGVVVAYLVLVLGMLRVAITTREPFGRLVASGVAVVFGVQSCQNLGMTVGLTPITGLPLPFVSFGGSSLLTSFLALGLLTSIGARRVRVMASQDLAPRDHRRLVIVLEDRPAGQLHRSWPLE